MKRVVKLGIAVFFLVFMIGGVSAENNWFRYTFKNVTARGSSNCFYLTINGSSEQDNSVKLNMPAICLYWLDDLDNRNLLKRQYIDSSIYPSPILYIGDIKYSYGDMTDAKFVITQFYGGNMTSILDWSRTFILFDMWDDKKNYISGKIVVYVEDKGTRCTILLEGFKIENNNQRLATIESLQQSLNNTLLSFQNILTNHESRIMALENKNCSCQTPPQETFPSYLMKLSSNDRKDIVCAYGEEKHLYGVEGLGWTCGLTYKTSRTGKESVTCKCKKS